MPFTDNNVTQPTAEATVESDHSWTLQFHATPNRHESKLAFQTNSSKAPSDCQAMLKWVDEQIREGNIVPNQAYQGWYFTVVPRAEAKAAPTDIELPNAVAS